MRVLITGASSGIGRDMALLLDQMGHSLVLVARRRDRLEALAQELEGDPVVIPLDLSQAESCTALHRLTQGLAVDALVNNAGCGVYGPFSQTDLERELEMINLNIRALHMLTKLYLADFRRQGRGVILNVASSAAFSPGPLLASYYATKAYVLRLTQAVGEELRQAHSPVAVCAFCPGPVATEFDSAAGVRSSLGGMSSRRAAQLAVAGMLRRRPVTVPGLGTKALAIAQRLLPDRLLLAATYRIQKHKGEGE